MTFNELKFKTRKYWLWINLAVAISCIVLVVILSNFGLNRLWAFSVYFPLIILGFNPDMVLTKDDMKKVMVFIMSLLYVFLIYSNYAKTGSISGIFNMSTLRTMVYLTVFIGILAFFFGYLPAKILQWKDKKILNTAVYDSTEAATYIYPKLPEEIAQKTSDNELGGVLELYFESMFVPIDESFVEQKGNEEKARKKILETYPHLTKNDLDVIFALELEYMKDIGIEVK